MDSILFFDMSNGLSSVIICNECAAELKEHVKAVEGILKTEIGYLSLSSLSSFKK